VVSTGQSGTRAWRCRGRVKCLLSSGSGPEFVFVHTQTHPDNRGAHPKSHPRPRAHSLARKQTFACTENQLSDEKCTQANPPLLSWSSWGAHPVAGYAWRPPRVVERAEGVVDGKGEGGGCFVRVYLFRNSSQACSRTYVYICIYINI